MLFYAANAPAPQAIAISGAAGLGSFRNFAILARNSYDFSNRRRTMVSFARVWLGRTDEEDGLRF